MKAAAPARVTHAGKTGASKPTARGFAGIRKLLKAAAKRGELSPAEVDKALERLDGGRKTSHGDAAGRRDDILAAAGRVFARKGYHAATLQDIADELSLTRPAFYYYFKSKQEILEAICIATAAAADEVLRRESARPAQSYEQALRQTLLAYTVHIAESETTTIMWRNFGEMSPARQRSLIASRRVREQRVIDLIDKGIRRGEFSTPEPKIAALAGFETLNSLHNWFDRKGRLSVEQVARLLVDQVLHGLIARR